MAAAAPQPWAQSVSPVWSSVSVCTVLSSHRDTCFGLRSFMVALPPALWSLQPLCSYSFVLKGHKQGWVGWGGNNSC